MYCTAIQTPFQNVKMKTVLGMCFYFFLFIVLSIDLTHNKTRQERSHYRMNLIFEDKINHGIKRDDFPTQNK